MQLGFRAHIDKARICHFKVKWLHALSVALRLDRNRSM